MNRIEIFKNLKIKITELFKDIQNTCRYSRQMLKFQFDEISKQIIKLRHFSNCSCFLRNLNKTFWRESFSYFYGIYDIR